jgi:hypothetical protein
MTRNRIVARTVLTAGLAVGTALAMALPAQATGGRQDVTCDGMIGAQSVGDVVVADGTACVLDGTKVKGGITVGAGAALDMTNVSVYKDIISNAAGRVSAVDTLGYAGFSHTGRGQVRLTNTGFFRDVTISGEARFTGSGVAVGGSLTATTVSRFDVSNSFVLGSLSADQSFNGSNVCGNTVGRDAKVSRGGGAILIGGTETCAGNTVAGSVIVDSNNATVISIAGNTVFRDLDCTTNRPAPTVGTNTVRGQKLGQCA